MIILCFSALQTAKADYIYLYQNTASVDATNGYYFTTYDHTLGGYEIAQVFQPEQDGYLSIVTAYFRRNLNPNFYFSCKIQGTNNNTATAYPDDITLENSTSIFPSTGVSDSAMVAYSFDFNSTLLLEDTEFYSIVFYMVNCTLADNDDLLFIAKITPNYPLGHGWCHDSGTYEWKPRGTYGYADLAINIFGVEESEGAYNYHVTPDFYMNGGIEFPVTTYLFNHTSVDWYSNDTIVTYDTINVNSLVSNYYLGINATITETDESFAGNIEILTGSLSNVLGTALTYPFTSYLDSPISGNYDGSFGDGSAWVFSLVTQLPTLTWVEDVSTYWFIKIRFTNSTYQIDEIYTLGFIIDYYYGTFVIGVTPTPTPYTTGEIGAGMIPINLMIGLILIIILGLIFGLIAGRDGFLVGLIIAIFINSLSGIFPIYGLILCFIIGALLVLNKGGYV